MRAFCHGDCTYNNRSRASTRRGRGVAWAGALLILSSSTSRAASDGARPAKVAACLKAHVIVRAFAYQPPDESGRSSRHRHRGPLPALVKRAQFRESDISAQFQAMRNPFVRKTLVNPVMAATTTTTVPPIHAVQPASSTVVCSSTSGCTRAAGQGLSGPQCARSVGCINMHRHPWSNKQHQPIPPWS
jgi:hypothetical protein